MRLAARCWRQCSSAASRHHLVTARPDSIAMMRTDTLQRSVQRSLRHRHVRAAVFRLACGSEVWEGAAGDFAPGQRFYIASIDKLLLAGLVLRQVQAGTFSLDCTLPQLLPQTLWQGLAMQGGQDITGQIRLRDLLGHTSGLPCYLEDAARAEVPAMQLLMSGQDASWTLPEALQLAQRIGLRFAPGSPGKAHYADTNYRLLAACLEHACDRPIDTQLLGLFAELGMADTGLLHLEPAGASAAIGLPHGQHHLRSFAASTQTEVASTCADLIRLLRAWFDGAFWPRQRLHELQQWRRIFFPFQYGLGIQRFAVPRWLSPFAPSPVLIGHCGSVGSVLFRVADQDVWISGTLNTAGSGSAAIRRSLQLLNALS